MADEFTGYRIDMENRVAVESGALQFFCAATEGEAKIPDVVDPELWNMILECQFQMSSCGGHAEENSAESLLYWEHGITQPMSRLFAYLMGQKECGLFGRDMGVTIEALTRAMSTIGICEATLCPYPKDARYPGAGWQPTQQMLDNAKLYLLKSYISLKKQADPWAATLDWIGNYGTGLLGIRWAPTMDKNGVVRRWTAGGSGGHAVCAVGYVWDWDNPGQRLIKVANSHSTTFGKNGYFYFTADAWRDMIRDPYTVAIGQTSLTSPKRTPREWDGRRPLMVRYGKSLI